MVPNLVPNLREHHAEEPHTRSRRGLEASNRRANRLLGLSQAGFRRTRFDGRHEDVAAHVPARWSQAPPHARPLPRDLGRRCSCARHGRAWDIVKGSDPAADRARAKADPTFGELAELYLKHHARAKKKPRSVLEDQRTLTANLLPAWRDRKLPTISRRDVIALLDEVVARGAPIQANRVKALCSTIFNFAIGRDLLEHNPAHRVPQPALERSRERRLSDDEIRRLWAALEPEPEKVQVFYRLALLTAARRGEILGMAWDEVDLDKGWWILPAARAKNGTEHRIPLSPTAIDLLRSLEATQKSPFVFAGGRLGQPMKNPQVWAARIHARAELTDFIFHDLRRSVASGMTSIGIERLTVSKILNHTEGGVTRVYDRHSYDREKRTAVLKWEKHLNRLLTGYTNESNVVELHA
jgi:integrase